MARAEDALVPAVHPPAVPSEESVVGSPGDRLPTVVAAIPLAIAAAVAALTLVASLCLLVSAYRPALVLPIGIPSAVVCAAVVLVTAPKRERRTLWPNLLALLAVAVMVWFNIRYGAQDIFVIRDDGTYVVTAQWLAHHSSGRIPSQSALFGVSSGNGSSVGFGGTNPGLLQSQYVNAAPLLVSMGGWISETWLLRVAPFIGGAALLAFYALARSMVREWWALGAMTLLAVSLPMMHFSREVFSEPAVMLFLLGGMALLFVCQEVGDSRASMALHAVAGITGGATALAHIDGGIFLLAACGYTVLRLARAVAGQRRRVALEVGVLLLAALVPYVLGMRLVVLLSSLYWNDHSGQAYIPGVVSLAILAVGAVVIAVAWRGGRARAKGIWLAGWATSIGAVGLLVLAVVGASRPWWLVQHQYIGPSFTNYLAYFQRQEHLAIDGTRSYGENSLTWISWYVSVVVVVAGVIGIAWLLRRVGRTGRPALLGFLLVFLSFGVVSVTRPDITADQIWSTRRFLPIVIPGLLIGSAYVGQRLWRFGRKAQVVVVVLALVALGFTLKTDKPLATVPEGVGQLPEIQAICQNLPADAAVAMVGGVASGYEMTVRSFCGVPVIGLPASAAAPLTSAELSTMRGALLASSRTLYVLTDDPKLLPPAASAAAVPVRPTTQIQTRFWLPALVHPADTVEPNARTMYLVVVAPDGTVTTPPGQRTLVMAG